MSRRVMCRTGAAGQKQNAKHWPGRSAAQQGAQGIQIKNLGGIQIEVEMFLVFCTVNSVLNIHSLVLFLTQLSSGAT